MVYGSLLTIKTLYNLYRSEISRHGKNVRKSHRIRNQTRAALKGVKNMQKMQKYFTGYMIPSNLSKPCKTYSKGKFAVVYIRTWQTLHREHKSLTGCMLIPCKTYNIRKSAMVYLLTHKAETYASHKKSRIYKTK